MTYTFLAINGVRITTTAAAAYDFINNCHAAGTFDFEHILDWLKGNIAAVSPD